MEKMTTDSNGEILMTMGRLMAVGLALIGLVTLLIICKKCMDSTNEKRKQYQRKVRANKEPNTCLQGGRPERQELKQWNSLGNSSHSFESTLK